MFNVTTLRTAGILMSLAGCFGDEPEWLNQAAAIARHGPTMKAILRKHPSQRIAVLLAKGRHAAEMRDPSKHLLAPRASALRARLLGREVPSR